MAQTLYISTVGSSRGSGFEVNEKINLMQFLNIFYASNDDDDFEEYMDEAGASQFSYLFYNDSLTSKNWRKKVMSVLSRVMNGKVVVEEWEEGTTGIGLDKKAVKTAVEKAELKMLMGSCF